MGKMLPGEGDMLLDVRFSVDDMASGYDIMLAIRSKEPEINVDNLYISGRSVREITGFKGESLSDYSPDELKNSRAIPSFDAISYSFNRLTDTKQWGKDGTGKTVLPAIVIKTGEEFIAPVITEGRLPELAPEAKPLSGLRRIFASRDAIDENQIAMIEYEKSVSQRERMIAVNSGLDYINEASRIYAKTANGTALTAEERGFIDKGNINMPNSAVKRINLSELSKSRPSANNDIGLTAKTAEAEKRAQQRDMGM